MSLVNSRELLRDAQAHGYAVGAFNVENLEMMQAVVAGQVTTPSKGWTITEENGYTVFTKFGAEETLQLQFPAVTTAVEENVS